MDIPTNSSTGELVTLLAQALPVKRPMRLNVASFFVVIGAALATILVLGLRSEFKTMHLPMSFWVKTEYLAILMSIATRRLILASRPLAAPQTPWLEILLIVTVLLMVEHECMTVRPEVIFNWFKLVNFPCCLVCVTVYGLVGMAGLTVLMRRYAPADARQCGGLIGFAAAAAGAVGYSIHCPLDSPTFVVVAYGLPMLALWVIGRVVLPRWIKW